MTYLRRPAIFIFTALVLLMSATIPVHAEESVTITDAQLAQIRSRCSDIQTTLDRIHANDAVLRVNRGQLYELISNKLMARLNSRIALNRLDSSSLVTVTNGYESHLRDFRADYQLYEEALSDTIKTNCVDQPVSFYDKLQSARDKRTKVFKSIQAIAGDVKAYQKAFDAFAKPYKENTL